MLRCCLNRQGPINPCILGVVEVHVRIVLPCLSQIFSPFTLLSAAFHSRQTTRVPQTKKRRRCNALIHNAICLKAFSLDHSPAKEFQWATTTAPSDGSCFPCAGNKSLCSPSPWAGNKLASPDPEAPNRGVNSPHQPGKVGTLRNCTSRSAEFKQTLSKHSPKLTLNFHLSHWHAMKFILTDHTLVQNTNTVGNAQTQGFNFHGQFVFNGHLGEQKNTPAFANFTFSICYVTN